jgi:hypothetical protein
MTDDNNSDFLGDRDPIPEEKLQALKDSLEKLVGSNSRLDETDMVENIMQEYLANVFDSTETEVEVTKEPSLKQLAANQESWMREVCAKLSRQEETLNRQHRDLQKLQEQVNERNDWYEARIEKQKNTGFAVMFSVMIAGYLAIFHMLAFPSSPKRYTQIGQEVQTEQEAQEARDDLRREAKKLTQEERDEFKREAENITQEERDALKREVEEAKRKSK